MLSVHLTQDLAHSGKELEYEPITENAGQFGERFQSGERFLGRLKTLMKSLKARFQGRRSAGNRLPPICPSARAVARTAPFERRWLASIY